jgi:hypothetical protein
VLARPQRANEVEPIAVRQTQIDDKEVVIDVGRRRLAIDGAGDRVDGVAGLAQHVSGELLQAHAVFNEQQPHGDGAFAKILLA